jgi:hypothetical protein
MGRHVDNISNLVIFKLGPVVPRRHAPLRTAARDLPPVGFAAAESVRRPQNGWQF